MTDREERIARNEALFREVNERTKEIAESLSPGDPPRTLQIFCECGQIDCTARLDVLTAEYERARSRPEWFIVAAGHDAPDVERVVEERNRCLIVEKHAEEGQLARATDPRS